MIETLDEELIIEIRKSIKDVSMILVGCGSELSAENHCQYFQYSTKNMIEPLKEYGIESMEKLYELCGSEERYQWLFKVLEKNFNRGFVKEKNFYNYISKILEGKNYFVISTNTDSLIYQSDLKQEQLVTPCGNSNLFQCSAGCSHVTWENDSYVEAVMGHLEEICQYLREKDYERLERYKPVCKLCGAAAEYNIKRLTKEYVEEGYLSQWSKYMSWLQKTLNKKLLIFEFGENFALPTVMRWPFEKTVYFNQKAKLFRINETLPQIADEIKERAAAFKMNSFAFLEELNFNIN